MGDFGKFIDAGIGRRNQETFEGGSVLFPLETSLMTVPCSARSSLMVSFWIFVGRCFTANFMERGAFVV